MIDLKSHNYTSLSISEFQTDICKKHKWDPEDPRCGRLTLSGSFSKVPKNGDEHKSAMNEMVKRHPEMKEWEAMSSHDFYLAKLNIQSIWLIDFFGGAANITPAEYYNAK